MRNKVDVVIIGGGIMGASIAFRLAERGLSVTVVEKSFLAGGPTGKSSALVRQHYTHEVTASMALFSLRIFQNFQEIVGDDSGFKETGYLWLAPADQLSALQANVAMQQGVGIDTRILDEKTLREIAPTMAEPDKVCVAYEPEGGFADPSMTTVAFANGAKRQGAEILQDTEVLDIDYVNGRVQGVMTSRGPISAGVVINSAGPWATRLAAKIGVDLPIEAARVQIAMMEPPEDAKPDPLVFLDLPNLTYFRPETGGHTLLGSLGPGEGEVVDPDRYKEVVDTEFILNTGERLIKRFDCMERSISRGGYTGVYDMTPDRHAIVDEVPAGSGFYVVAGHSGHGFKLSPAVGVMVADMVMGTETAGLDRHIFRYNRFAENDLVKPRTPYQISRSA